ncbi:hypothetical protein, partial [Acidaminococcus timonensis]|uniref:hypothetical protein n=1 Tax=Acidaminococcus timonensis TaxID=1871002 RepID=UPI0025E96F38
VGGCFLFSFPEREGEPSEWLVDGFLRRTFDVKTPYPQAGPFPLPGGHNSIFIVHSLLSCSNYAIILFMETSRQRAARIARVSYEQTTNRIDCRR